MNKIELEIMMINNELEIMMIMMKMMMMTQILETFLWESGAAYQDVIWPVGN